MTFRRPPNDDFLGKLRGWQPRSTAIRAHLRRWADDDRAEDLWKTISRAAGANLGAEEFIRKVAWTAMAARGLPARIELYKSETAAVRSAQEARVAAAFASEKSPSAIAEILEEAAWLLRLSDDFSMLDEYPAGTISRRQKGDTQKRRAFSLTMSDFFSERCKMWMDDETGVLLEIAFGPRGEDISQEVRDYRRARDKKVGV